MLIDHLAQVVLVLADLLVLRLDNAAQLLVVPLTRLPHPIELTPEVAAHPAVLGLGRCDLLHQYVDLLVARLDLPVECRDALLPEEDAACLLHNHQGKIDLWLSASLHRDIWPWLGELFKSRSESSESKSFHGCSVIFALIV
mgnify:CR=1 FL=1